MESLVRGADSASRNDMADGALNVDGTYAPIAASLAWLQEWVAQNVASANPIP